MSDFSELCPLFETGVFNEITFPALKLLTSIAITSNLLGGTGDAATCPCDFKFSRRVIVTNAYMRRTFSNTMDISFKLGKRVGSGTAAATAFGSFTGTNTLSVYANNCWKVFGAFTATTMEAADVLNLSTGTLTADVPGEWDLMVRYKEA